MRLLKGLVWSRTVSKPRVDSQWSCHGCAHIGSTYNVRVQCTWSQSLCCVHGTVQRQGVLGKSYHFMLIVVFWPNRIVAIPVPALSYTHTILSHVHIHVLYYTLTSSYTLHGLMLYYTLYMYMHSTVWGYLKACWYWLPFSFTSYMYMCTCIP